MLKWVIQKHFRFPSEMVILCVVTRLHDESLSSITGRVQTILTLIRDRKDEGGENMIKEIILQALPPSVSAWMKAWCKGKGDNILIEE